MVIDGTVKRHKIAFIWIKKCDPAGLENPPALRGATDFEGTLSLPNRLTESYSRSVKSQLHQIVSASEAVFLSPRGIRPWTL
jgi:hypothetical protein